MMKASTRRTIIRCFHLIASIPIMGYIYGPPAEVAQYADAARWVFMPIIILSGFWMYAGVAFAALGVALWLGAYRLSGVGTAILCQVVLFIAHAIWLAVQRRKNRGGLPAIPAA